MFRTAGRWVPVLLFSLALFGPGAHAQPRPAPCPVEVHGRPTHQTSALKEPDRVVVKPMLADLPADHLTRINCLCFGLQRGG